MKAKRIKSAVLVASWGGGGMWGLVGNTEVKGPLGDLGVKGS